MELRYERYDGLPPEPLLCSLLDLLAGVFGNQTQAELFSELTYQFSRTPGLTFLAIDDGQVVGCKLGYERKPGHFYSWLGGVHTAYRGRGIARELMHRQHDWCRQQNYHTVRTQTYNQWRAMLILNLRAGFDIIGTQQGKQGLTIILEKRL
ncbi:GNAT family N-acetyltransferase [Spirosoma taeanense]|uniref:GNAT family N-acetyltransferase n=1 Tax=Spirosoma taeanense TaxID=2735870 RepID=A0A6M5Y5X2_9BACT|nr:GNAT family N-acetyltransferase [Spirosoma taeanense]QJW89215.1 GNAT family N-acetyltransferase [Spirosoma taeanense]